MNQSISYSMVAHLYDSYVTAQFDLPFFLKEAHDARGKVLELACGTGRISIPLLQSGIDLTCVDYSKEMLKIFRKKLEENRLSCPLFNQDMADLSIPDHFDLIFIPFHSFSEILDESKHARALTRIREHLAESGRFICTLQNPIVRTRSMDGTVKELGRFPAEAGRTLVVSTCFEYDNHSQTASGIQFYDVYNPQGAIVEKKQLPASFRLFHRRQFERIADTAGFKVVRLYGDYERSPFGETKSPFMIWVLEGTKAETVP